LWLAKADFDANSCTFPRSARKIGFALVLLLLFAIVSPLTMEKQTKGEGKLRAGRLILV